MIREPIVDAAPCSSYRPGRICADGFPLGYPASSACTGRRCGECGRFNDKLPPCQDDDIAPRWLNEDGTPRLYRPPEPHQGRGGGES
jgi:hypothetical protein